MSGKAFLRLAFTETKMSEHRVPHTRWTPVIPDDQHSLAAGFSFTSAPFTRQFQHLLQHLPSRRPSNLTHSAQFCVGQIGGRQYMFIKSLLLNALCLWSLGELWVCSSTFFFPVTNKMLWQHTIDCDKFCLFTWLWGRSGPCLFLKSWILA